MRKAQFVEDLAVGAKRFWLVEPLDGFDYVIVAPEPSSGRTSIYAATDHGEVNDVKDAEGNPLALVCLEGQMTPEEALGRVGYEVTGSMTASNMRTPSGPDSPIA